MFRCLNFHRKNVMKYVTFSWCSYANTLVLWAELAKKLERYVTMYNL